VLATRRDRAPSHHIRTSGATAISPSKSLVSNASPISAPEATKYHGRSRRSPRAATANAPTTSTAMTESIVSLRDVITATGSTASASPPTSATVRPKSVLSRS
jgi:hypothetical protein